MITTIFKTFNKKFSLPLYKITYCYISIAKMRDHISPFAMLQTSGHTLFFPRKTSQRNFLKTFLSFLFC